MRRYFITYCAALLLTMSQAMSEDKATTAAEHSQDALFPSEMSDSRLVSYLKQTKYQKAMAAQDLTVSGMLEFAGVSGKEMTIRFKSSGLECHIKPDDKFSTEILEFLKLAKEGDVTSSSIFETWLAKVMVKGRLSKNISLGKIILEDAEVVAWYGIEVTQLTWDEDGNLAKSSKKLGAMRKNKEAMSDLDSPPPPDFGNSDNSGNLFFSIVAGAGLGPSLTSHMITEGKLEDLSGVVTKVVEKDGVTKIELKNDKGHLVQLELDSDPLALGPEFREIYRIAKSRKCASGIEIQAKGIAPSTASQSSASKEYDGGSIVGWTSSKDGKLSIYPVQQWIKESVPLKQAAAQH